MCMSTCSLNNPGRVVSPSITQGCCPARRRDRELSFWMDKLHRGREMNREVRAVGNRLILLTHVLSSGERLLLRVVRFAPERGALLCCYENVRKKIYAWL